MLTDLDEKQLLLMKQRIYDFEPTTASLDSLLSLTRSLEELLGSLKNIDKKWIEDFRTEWWELEFTSSLMMDREADDLSNEDIEAVSVAMQNMKKMIEEALSKQTLNEISRSQRNK